MGAQRPDLSAFPRDVRVRIAVAETQGATWSFDGTPLNGGWPGGWFLRRGATLLATQSRHEGGRGGVYPALPDYLTDPAREGRHRSGVGLMARPYEADTARRLATAEGLAVAASRYLCDCWYFRGNPSDDYAFLPEKHKPGCTWRQVADGTR